MYRREHHRRIVQVLRALDAEMLRAHRCYFGGGTAIVMKCGEYRESLDMDFMVSDIGCYRKLRQTLNTESGLGKLLGVGDGPLDSVPAVRADQYGIRTRLKVDGSEIKSEIVFEARIEFDEPRGGDCLEGVFALTATDLAASKLLANVDRWADAGVFSRDIIDLAMLENDLDSWRGGRAKAESAYGEAVGRDAIAAVSRLQESPEQLAHCLEKLNVYVPQAFVLKKLKQVAKRFQ
jgi:hypothetical protein